LCLIDVVVNRFRSGACTSNVQVRVAFTESINGSSVGAVIV